MHKILTVLLTFAAISSFGQQQIKNKPLKESLESVTGKQGVSSDGIITRSFVAENGEKFLRFEITVNASVASAWKAVATEEGIKTWMAPVALVDLRTGGTVKTNYNKAAKIGDDGTITLGIINYIPLEILTYKITLNDKFAEKCRKEDKNLQEIIQIKSLGENKTKIISTMEGWGQGKEWDEAYSFFEKGNKWSIEQLLKSFKN